MDEPPRRQLHVTDEVLLSGLVSPQGGAALGYGWDYPVGKALTRMMREATGIGSDNASDRCQPTATVVERLRLSKNFKKAAHVTNRVKTRQKPEIRSPPPQSDGSALPQQRGRRSPAPSAGAATAAEAPPCPAPQQQPLGALPSLARPLELPRAAFRGLWLAERGGAG